MKLTIKTLDQKTFHVEFDESKTVWDLKAHLWKLPEIGVQPEQQQIIYAGRVLLNDDVLKTYSIDERKFLVVMAKKPLPSTQGPDGGSKEELKTDKKEAKSKSTRPSTSSADQPGPSARKSEQKQATPTTTPSQPKERVKPAATAAPPPTPTDAPILLLPRPNDSLFQPVEPTPTAETTDALVHSIMNMGYAEVDVRRALLASFNNPDRAIEYLIEGIPNFPGMLEQAEPLLPDTLNPLAFLRSDPRFNQMRRIIQQRPDLLGTVLAKIGETNPALLTIIREHQEDFVRMLNETEDLPDEPQMGDDIVEVLLTDEERLAVERLVGLGFPREIVLQAYIACEKNEEQTADFLCRHMEE